jgi:DNA-binding transcriptional MerR regulator
MITQTVTLTIQHVAAATGLSVHTLRYYERIGLIHAIDRADNTHRRYSDDDIGWIKFLMKLRATGMSIQDMQRYAELQRQGEVTLSERVEMLRALEATVTQHIAELNEHLSLVRFKIGYYSEIVAAKAQEACRVDP